VVTASPGPNHVWIAGHYSWTNGQWTWINGTWAVPPTQTATWVPGRYDAATRRWTEGHWDVNGATTSARGITQPANTP
jgi:hypothetical protein